MIQYKKKVFGYITFALLIMMLVIIIPATSLIKAEEYTSSDSNVIVSGNVIDAALVENSFYVLDATETMKKEASKDVEKGLTKAKVHYMSIVGAKIDGFEGSKATVKIKIPAKVNKKSVQLLHYKSDGTIAKIANKDLTIEGEYASVEVESFGSFAIYTTTNLLPVVLIVVTLILAIIILIIFFAIKKKKSKDAQSKADEDDSAKEIIDEEDTAAPEEVAEEEQIEDEPTQEEEVVETEEIVEEEETPAEEPQEEVVEDTPQEEEAQEEVVEEQPEEEEEPEEEVNLEAFLMSLADESNEEDDAKEEEADEEDEEDDEEPKKASKSTPDNVVKESVKRKLQPVVKVYYYVIKNKIMSKEKVRERYSFRFNSFSIGRKTIVKIAVSYRTLRLYLALDPNSIESKYHIVDVSNKKSHAATPAMLKVKSQRGVKYALELLDRLFEGTPDIDSFTPVDYTKQFPFDQYGKAKDEYRGIAKK